MLLWLVSHSPSAWGVLVTLLFLAASLCDFDIPGLPFLPISLSFPPDFPGLPAWSLAWDGDFDLPGLPFLPISLAFPPDFPGLPAWAPACPLD